MLLLILFGGNVYATKPREAGIGFKYGFTRDNTLFRSDDDNTWYIKSDNTGETRVNNPGTTQIPIFIQLAETLEGSFLFSNWFFDVTRLIQTDHPPRLVGTSYDNLVKSETFEVPTENTYTNQFAIRYPQYSTIINNASNPSLSADYYVTKITVGKTVGVFIPLGERHRLLTLGIGGGVNYIEGSYSISICEPFFISSNVRSASPQGEFREGFCLNETKLFSKGVNHFSLELNLPIGIYSYIGDDFEFDFAKIEYYFSLSPSDFTEAPLYPTFQYNSVTTFSVLAHF